MFGNDASRRSDGNALVITLCFLVLVSALLVAFFNTSAIHRKISASNAAMVRADLVARAALDIITGDLRAEIAAGSEVAIYGTNAVCTPLSDKLFFPCRVGDQGIANLIKQSTAGEPFWSGSSYTGTITSPIRATANNSTLDVSRNGRSVSTNRWNKSGLLGDPGTGAAPALPAGYTPPDWIIVTRQGPLTNAASVPPVNTLADAASTNADYVIGRFAYAIFDESGLLDANVAGFPNSLSGTEFSTRRGLLPQVDLAGMPGVADANSFVAWRNQATAASAQAYTNAVLTATNGFVTVNPGDQALVSRQDLIDYVKANPDKISTAALPYLGTCSRDVNGPSYSPNPSRPSPNDDTNPDVLAIRVQAPFTRDDGTIARAGDPLVKHRFPLSRLALFADPDANAVRIKKYFCIERRTDGLWDYVDPDSDAISGTLPTIKTLAKVAEAGREPTFWELLQAGIYAGSLGANLGETNMISTVADSNATRQLLAIGLNLIDQYDADDTPTVLKLGGLTPSSLNDLSIVGGENLPYISWFGRPAFRDQIVIPPTTGNYYINHYLTFMMWNPHRNAPDAAPGIFRLSFSGKTQTQATSKAMPAAGLPQTLRSPQIVHTPDTSRLVFNTTAARNFAQIDALRASDADLAATSDVCKFPMQSGATTYWVGLCTGMVEAPATWHWEATTGNSVGPSFHSPNTPLTIILEKKVGANWIPYEILPQFSFETYDTADAFNTLTTQLNKLDGWTNDAVSARVGLVHSDPRTVRLGFCYGSNGITPMFSVAGNLVDSSGNSFNEIWRQGGIKTKLADYAWNCTATGTNTYYADPDGQVRQGDNNPTAYGHSNANSPFCPSATGSKDARPILLNRPFRSVAEMGYAFRDVPWRSIDFQSNQSADAGLLDLFCLNENRENLRSGVVNINSASLPVVKALLLNAGRDPAAITGTPLTDDDAIAIAQAIKTQIGNGFVVRNASDLPILTSLVAASLPDRFKFKREVLARSFADVHNGRTWNLLIDIIAQSGRYLPTSASLNDFVVEGEQRYWLHIAIDRLTGKEVSRFIEPVLQ